MRGKPDALKLDRRVPWRRAAGAALATMIAAAGVLAGSTAAFADPPTAPDAPAQPTVTTAAGNITVSFTAPADGGSAITGYTASCTSGNGGLSGSNTGTDSPIVVGPLTVGKTYTCTVVAANGVGDSPASPASNAIVAAASAPDTPAQPVATPSGNSISLALDAPNDNGSAVTSYDATCTSSDGGVDGSATSDSLPIVVSELSPGHTYTCNLTATNDVGTSAASPDSDATSIDAVAPSAPTVASVMPGDGTITVTFSDPVDDGGSAVTSESVDCTSDNGGTEGTATGSSPVDVAVDNGYRYTCAVTATNDAGTSDPFDPSDAVIAGTPTVAGGAAVTPANNGAFVTYGDSVADNNDPVTSYTADCRSSDGGDPGTATAADVPVYVDGLTNGSTYTCTLTATNSRGDGPASDASDPFSPTTIPGTPDAPTVTPGDGHAIVTFDAPSDSGDPITSYDVECDSSDGGATGTATDAASPIDVPGLDNTNTYTCTVRATNSSGTGLWSPPSAEVVVGPGAPDAPDITDLTRGSNSVTIGFTTPDDHDSAITSYTATCSSDDGGATVSASDDSSPIEVDGLTNSKYYTCTVDATNDVGTSPESSASDQFLAAAQPDAPHIVRMALGDNSVTLTLAAPADNGEPISNYEATCTSNDGGDTVITDDADTSITAEGLTNGSTYTCNVTATNVMGTSDPSADSAPFVAATYPDAPTVTGLTRGANTATVAFSAPWNGSAVIRSYTATCASSDGGTTRANQGSGSPITVGYLTNGNTYTCSVHATNVIGDGAESDPSDSFVAATTPRPPVVSGVSLGSNSVSVAFRSTGDGADAITTYTATCTSSNGGTTRNNSGASSPIAVSSLSNSKSYTCTVVATNGIGNSAASAASSSFVAATVPAAPSVTSVTRGSNSGSVAFSAPANNGSAITSYRATCASSDGGTSRNASATKSPISVGSLTNAKTYTCTVTATNAIGTSSASVASAPFTAATTPGTPTVTAATRSSGAVAVAFTAPANGGAAITSYKASCTSSNGGTARTGTGATSPVTVTSLTSTKTYTCTLAAVNAIGTSAVSSPSSSFLAAAVPAVPKISGLTRSSNAVSVAFVAPANNGDAITGYTATCTSSNGGATETTSGASSPLLVASLTNAKTYSCTVLATNTMGNSPASAGSTFVAAAVPDAPTITLVTAARGTATITFSVPNTNGAAITSYAATCTSSNGGTTRTATNSRSPLNITLLTVGKTYTCTATATNAIGTSVASAPWASFTA